MYLLTFDYVFMLSSPNNTYLLYGVELFFESFVLSCSTCFLGRALFIRMVSSVAHAPRKAPAMNIPHRARARGRARGDGANVEGRGRGRHGKCPNPDRAAARSAQRSGSGSDDSGAFQGAQGAGARSGASAKGHSSAPLPVRHGRAPDPGAAVGGALSAKRARCARRHVCPSHEPCVPCRVRTRDQWDHRWAHH